MVLSMAQVPGVSEAGGALSARGIPGALRATFRYRSCLCPRKRGTRMEGPSGETLISAGPQIARPGWKIGAFIARLVYVGPFCVRRFQ
jgi:hypothetical protein